MSSPVKWGRRSDTHQVRDRAVGDSSENRGCGLLPSDRGSDQWTGGYSETAVNLFHAQGFPFKKTDLFRWRCPDDGGNIYCQRPPQTKETDWKEVWNQIANRSHAIGACQYQQDQPEILVSFSLANKFSPTNKNPPVSQWVRLAREL